MDALLTAAEARVLGSLIEKEITTPEYYPLSLNALVNACNQKSNRHPVMDLDEDAVRSALAGLEQKGLAAAARGAESRVSKFEHRLQERLNLRRGEVALLCVLLLRGAQTPGELRGRSDRLFSFGELDEVQATLQRLVEYEPPLVRALPREPGTKEVRYVETLSARNQSSEPATPATHDEPQRAAQSSELKEQVERLEAQIRELRARIETLEQKLEPLLG